MISKGEVHSRFSFPGEFDPVKVQINRGFVALGMLLRDFSVRDDESRGILEDMVVVRDRMLGSTEPVVEDVEHPVEKVADVVIKSVGKAAKKVSKKKKR